MTYLLFVMIIFRFWGVECDQPIGQSVFPNIKEPYIYMTNKDNKLVKAYFSFPHESRQLIVTNLDEHMNYTLYTRSSENGVKIRKVSDLKSTSFDKNKPIKFVTHGWLSSGSGDACQEIKNGYLKNFDLNVIIMNWEEIASDVFYPIPMLEVSAIASHLGKFINQMIETFGINPKHIHIIGHSLGAQIVGLVHKSLNGRKLGRVTGLDPASPGFDFLQVSDRISNKSASFVDVIHSCGGFLGIMEPIGHVDFYPNGGNLPQPGCNSSLASLSCSHGRSYQFFSDSLLNPKPPFYAVKCDSWNDFTSGKCDGNERVLMGYETSHKARGKFYLKTGASAPYSLGEP